MSIVSHIKEHAQLGIPDGFASLPANPTVAGAYGAMGVGALASAAGYTDFAGNRIVVEPFAMPRVGVVESITVIGTNNAGNSGIAAILRWGIATLVPDPASPVGLRVGAILAQSVSELINTAEGYVTLAAGQSVAVPPVFGVVLKQGSTNVATEKFSMRRTNPPSALPGLPAVMGGTSDLITSAHIVMVAVDVSEIPAEFAAGPLEVRYNHRPAVVVTWRAA